MRTFLDYTILNTFIPRIPEIILLEQIKLERFMIYYTSKTYG